MRYRKAIGSLTLMGSILVVIILLLGIMYVNYEALSSRISSIESSWSSYTSRNTTNQAGQVTKELPQTRYITLIAEPKTIEIANNVFYNAWTLNGTVPGPAIFVNQGDTIVFKLINKDPEMKHSIDFHAAEIDWSTAYASIAPGETKRFNFTVNYPGVFMYHCGTAPVLQHIGNGMYGAIIVRPSAQLPQAQGGEFVIVQSEFYLNSKPDQNGAYSGNYTKMLNGEPDYVVFNGKAFQYQSNPLVVKPNELVRLYILNAGPNHWSAFHVIGTVFDTVYIEGNPLNIQHGLQTLNIPPSGGAIVDMYFRDPGGKNPFVTHDFADASKGAVGLFQVTGGTLTTTQTTKTQPGTSVSVSILPGSGVNTSSPGYGPETIKVVIGINNTVIWKNNDNVPHTVTSTSGLFDSGNMNQGDTFSFTFNSPGTYTYYCIYHPWMKGKVIVLAQSGH